MKKIPEKLKNSGKFLNNKKIYQEKD